MSAADVISTLFAGFGEVLQLANLLFFSAAFWSELIMGAIQRSEGHHGDSIVFRLLYLTPTQS
jgi:hypothetical protein